MSGYPRPTPCAFCPRVAGAAGTRPSHALFDKTEGETAAKPGRKRSREGGFVPRQPSWCSGKRFSGFGASGVSQSKRRNSHAKSRGDPKAYRLVATPSLECVRFGRGSAQLPSVLGPGRGCGLATAEIWRLRSSQVPRRYVPRHGRVSPKASFPRYCNGLFWDDACSGGIWLILNANPNVARVLLGCLNCQFRLLARPMRQAFCQNHRGNPLWKWLCESGLAKVIWLHGD